MPGKPLGSHSIVFTMIFLALAVVQIVMQGLIAYDTTGTVSTSSTGSS
jgi:hypothetical protein